jgi:predicted RNase H-like HicB family nuclease
MILDEYLKEIKRIALFSSLRISPCNEHRHVIIMKLLRTRQEVNMLLEYTQKALEKAEYKKLDDGTWFAEIPGFEGVWANANTVEECRTELLEVLEEWLILKLRDNDPIPEIEGIGLKMKKVAVA